MSLPLKTGFPDGITCSAGYTIRFRATDPTTGADVAGVTVSNVSVFSETGELVTLAELPPVLLLPAVDAGAVGAAVGAVVGVAVAAP